MSNLNKSLPKTKANLHLVVNADVLRFRVKTNPKRMLLLLQLLRLSLSPNLATRDAEIVVTLINRGKTKKKSQGLDQKSKSRRRLKSYLRPKKDVRINVKYF